MNRKARLIIAILFPVIIFTLGALKLNAYNSTAVNNTGTYGDGRCDNRINNPGNGIWCYFTVSLSNGMQAYGGELVGHVEGHGAFGSAGGRASAVGCINDNPSYGGACYTWLGYDPQLGDGRADISGFHNLLQGDLGAPMTMFWVQVWSNDASWNDPGNGPFTATVHGRKVEITELSFPDTATVGDVFNVTWNTEWGVDTVLIHSQDTLNCSTGGYEVGVATSGTITCEAIASGTGEIIIAINGASATGPVQALRSKLVTITAGQGAPTYPSYGPSYPVYPPNYPSYGVSCSGDACQGFITVGLNEKGCSPVDDTEYQCVANNTWSPIGPCDCNAPPTYPPTYAPSYSPTYSPTYAPTYAVGGSCGSGHYNCSSGSSANNVSGGSSWTWNCNGSFGGGNASCSQGKTPAVWGPTNWGSCSVTACGWTGTQPGTRNCINPDGATTCSGSTNVSQSCSTPLCTVNFSGPGSGSTIIYTGGSTTLTWSSPDATSCTGTYFSTGGQVNGTATVSPISTTTYSISCDAGALATVKTWKVTVRKRPIFIEE